MPPIPVHLNTPLHPQGVTPETSAPALQENETLHAPPPPSRTVDAHPTPASTQTGPPPPQPGAVPSAPSSGQRAPTQAAEPVPPQPGAHPMTTTMPSVAATHVTTNTSVGGPTTMPPQFSIPPPPTTGHQTGSKSTAYDPQPNFNAQLGNSPLAGGTALSSTVTSQPSQPQYSPFETGASANDRRGSLEHPPGYVQNPYANDGTAEDRNRWATQEQQEKEGEGVMGTVKGVLGSVGASLKKAEEGVWEAVGVRPSR